MGPTAYLACDVCVGKMAVLTAWRVSLFRPNKPSLLPPLFEGEALACRVLDVNPSGVRFLQPVYLELPHFSALRDGERELVVLRTQDGGWNWQEVCVEDMKGIMSLLSKNDREKNTKSTTSSVINLLLPAARTTFPRT